MRSSSYAHGTTTVPLLGETIGDNLRRTVERVRDGEALVAPFQGFRATYTEMREAAVEELGLQAAAAAVSA
jgi:fatty-acyl-CoA synthase